MGQVPVNNFCLQTVILIHTMFNIQITVFYVCFAFIVYGTNPVKTANENSQEDIYLIWRKNGRTGKKKSSLPKQTNKQSIDPLLSHQTVKISEQFLKGSLEVKRCPFKQGEDIQISWKISVSAHNREDRIFFPVKYLIKPHKGANVLLKLMELYKKC